MSILDRVTARANGTVTRRGGAKSFVMPPMWSDGARVSLMSSALTPDRESMGGFESYIRDLYKANGIVYSCVAARSRVFSQARFQFQTMKDGRPGPLFGNPSLRLLERPWANGTTGELLTSAEIDVSVQGNFFACVCDTDGRIGNAADRRDPDLFLARLRPDWVTLVVGVPRGVADPWSPAARVMGLVYKTPGVGATDPLVLTTGEFMHYSPQPDPGARFKGMSWLTPIIRDAQADAAYTTHALAFLKNGATPNLVVNLGEDIDPADFDAFVTKFKQDYEGVGNAYKTLFLAGGADITPVSAEFQQLDLKGSQGKLETRIASAAGVHPSLAGLSEGLAGSSLNEGNFGAARRLFVDSTIRDLWAKFCSSAEVLVPPPDRNIGRLWYDARDIPFLRQDAGDEANTFSTQIQAIRQGIEAGFVPDAVVAAAKAADVSLLVGKHTGLVSVQLQTPGSASPEPVDAGGPPSLMPTVEPSANGNGRALVSTGR